MSMFLLTTNVMLVKTNFFSMEFLKYVYISLLADDFTPYRVLILQAFFYELHIHFCENVQCLPVHLNLLHN